MSDQQYTPTVLDQMRTAFAMRHWNLTGDQKKGERLFDKEIARIRAAAEQRGAVKALRDAAGAIEKNNIVFDGDHYQPCNSCMSIHMNWLDYRADLLEGDDETH